MRGKTAYFVRLSILFLLAVCICVPTAEKLRTDFQARPFSHSYATALGGSAYNGGYVPSKLRKAYNVTERQTGAGQAIAIISAYSDPTAASYLAAYSKKFNLPAADISVYDMAAEKDPEWALETSIDVQMAHAMAPEAKILLVEANMVEISVEEYLKMVAKNNKDTDVTAYRRNLDALARKENGAKCVICGSPIWAAGTAAGGWDGCFSRITGDADGSDDYEIV